MIRGMALGKFLPPHLGHVYLAEFGQHHVDDMTVVVCSIEREPIPGALRYRWMRELLPGVRVVHLTDELPQEPAEHPDFWDLWREALLRVLPAPPQRVFASESYGHRLARELGAEFVEVDIARAAVPVSGTAIRARPLEHWAHLPRCVRPYFARRVSVFGPESTGKSTLAARLAERYQTTLVREYARAYLEARQGHLEERDLLPIARGQIASEEALVPGCNRVLICDTDPLLTTVWSHTLHGACDPWITERARQRRYDLTLLTDVDVPWVPDPVRYLPDDRRPFFDRCEEALKQAGRPYLILRGPWDERFARACDAIDALLDEAGLQKTPHRLQRRSSFRTTASRCAGVGLPASLSGRIAAIWRRTRVSGHRSPAAICTRCSLKPASHRSRMGIMSPASPEENRPESTRSR
jgi:NadR type nicotinamide-nucleotide adenylyltransferase